MISPEIKSKIVEIAPIYISKAIASITLLGLSTTDFVDWFLRLIAAALAAVLTLYTIKRMSADIAFRKQETREKELSNYFKEEEIKQIVIENQIRTEELKKLVESIKPHKNEK